MLISLLNFKNIQRFLFIICLICFSSSVVAELIFNKVPCDLCLVTRYSYLCIAALTLFSIRFPAIILKKVLFVLIFCSLCFSLYHLGVENHWWAGPSKCTARLLTSIESIMNNTVTRCDVVNWRIFGISSTLYNMCIIAGLFWIYSLSFVVDYMSRRNED